MAERVPFDAAPAADARAEETPAEETPAEETPAEETPAEETPAEESPAEEIPAEAGTEPPASGYSRRWRLLLMGIAVPLAMMAAGTLLGWLLQRDLVVARLFQPQPWTKVMLWALAGMAASLASTSGLAALWPQMERELERTGLLAGEQVLRLAGWPVMLIVVMGAGLGEEVLFRGGLQPTLGVGLTAAMFGLAHGGWDLREMWSLVVAATVAGVIFGLLYKLSGLLLAAVLAHAGHNLLVTLYLLLRRGSGED